jgi:hypothetical protein
MALAFEASNGRIIVDSGEGIRTNINASLISIA